MQRLIYYISKMLVNAKTRYLPLEKLALALVHATKKLPLYFKAHMVYVLTKYHLLSLLKRFDFTGRIAKWGTRLGLSDIQYKPRHSVKGQVLADFITEFTPIEGGLNGVYNVVVQLWRVFINGAFNAQGARIGIVIVLPEGIKLEHSLRL